MGFPSKLIPRLSKHAAYFRISLRPRFTPLLQSLASAGGQTYCYVARALMNPLK